MNDSSLHAEGFTIGVPVYNEEALIESNAVRLVDYLRRLEQPFEVLIGSNGSTDATVQIGSELARRLPEVEFFHRSDRGVGVAFREFVLRARYDRLVSVDMDLSVDLDFVPRALEALDDNQIVIGAKRLGRQKRSVVRTMASGAYIGLCRSLLALDYEDFSHAAKAYRVAFVRRHEDALVDGAAFVTRLVYAGSQAGVPIAQIPVECDDQRSSHFNLALEFWSRTLDVFRLRFRAGR